MKKLISWICDAARKRKDLKTVLVCGRLPLILALDINMKPIGTPIRKFYFGFAVQENNLYIPYNTYMEKVLQRLRSLYSTYYELLEERTGAYDAVYFCEIDTSAQYLRWKMVLTGIYKPDDAFELLELRKHDTDFINIFCKRTQAII